MKTTLAEKPKDRMWRSALWIASAAILGFLAFGTAVQVDFVDPEVPLGQAISSLDWSRVTGGLRQEENVVMVAAVIAVIVTFTVSRSRKVRAGAMATGFLIPVLAEGTVMLLATAISPLLAFSMLAGKVDGEFYGEGMPQFAAGGLWMLLCLVYGIRESVLFLKQREPRDTEATEQLETPRS